MPKKIHTLGSASGIAAREYGCEDGPFVIQRSPFNQLLQESNLELQWDDIVYFPSISVHDKERMDNVAALCIQLAQRIETATEAHTRFLTIGGDHSCAIGTWTGAAAALKHQGNIGLIWVDAHMDSHTPLTTESGMIHGMPLAALMGYGDPRLTHIMYTEPKLQPQSVVLIGTRSFEKGEAELLKKLNVHIFDMEEITIRGMDTVMQEAITIVSKNTIGYGISIDIDAIDPKDAPGTGCVEANGIPAEQLYSALKQLSGDKRLIGAEIAEFDPHKDVGQQTEKLIFNLIKIIFRNESV